MSRRRHIQEGKAKLLFEGPESGTVVVIAFGTPGEMQGPPMLQ